MDVTTDPSATDREIANIRFLIAQRIGAIDDPGRRADDLVLRRLLRRDEELRRSLAGPWRGAAGPAPVCAAEGPTYMRA